MCIFLGLLGCGLCKTSRPDKKDELLKRIAKKKSARAYAFALLKDLRVFLFLNSRNKTPLGMGTNTILDVWLFPPGITPALKE